MRRCVVYPLLAGLMVGCQPQPARTTVTPIKRAPVPMPPPLTFDARPPVQLPSLSQRPRSSPAPRVAATSGIPRHWIPAARARAWEYVVIHHSDTARGSAASFDRYHRNVKHWDSLGYHFVIGNGNGAANGLVEVGPRWRAQEAGAHAGSLHHNERGIGICMVGDFDVSRPTAAQMQSLARLTGHLMRTYRIPASRVIGHSSFRHTNCPGRNLSIAQVRQLALRYAVLDAAGDPLAPLLEAPRLAAGELLHAIAQSLP